MADEPLLAAEGDKPVVLCIGSNTEHLTTVYSNLSQVIKDDAVVLHDLEFSGMDLESAANNGKVKPRDAYVVTVASISEYEKAMAAIPTDEPGDVFVVLVGGADPEGALKSKVENDGHAFLGKADSLEAGWQERVVDSATSTYDNFAERVIAEAHNPIDVKAMPPTAPPRGWLEAAGDVLAGAVSLVTTALGAIGDAFSAAWRSVAGGSSAEGGKSGPEFRTDTTRATGKLADPPKAGDPEVEAGAGARAEASAEAKAEVDASPRGSQFSDSEIHGLDDLMSDSDEPDDPSHGEGGPSSPGSGRT